MELSSTKPSIQTPARLRQTLSQQATSEGDVSTISWATRRSALAPGTVLQGRYDIESVLGTGGQGIVYRANDARRQQAIALKMLHVDGPAAVPKIKHEFRFLRDLLHPSLVPLYELVVDRELSFYTMGLVSGGDFLQAATDESALRRQMLQLAEVLAFLHGTDRVHRDVKPSNVLVRDDGRVVLLDFGIGLELGTFEEQGRTIAGTPRYLAPELLELKRATPASDAYSVGVMLFEALTGKHPEASGRTELLGQPAPRPRALVPDVSPDLDELCGALLERDPEKRLKMPDLARALRGTSATWALSEGQSSHYPKGDDQFYAGRASELGQLSEALSRARTGDEPVLVVLEAPSGFGKTATLNHFLAEQTEALVLRGKCSEHEFVAHKAIDSILESLVEHLLGLDGDTLETILAPSEVGVLAQLFPELARVPAIGRAGRSVPPPGDMRALRQRAYQALTRLLEWLGQNHTLIVAIEDLQWGDADSAKLLSEVFSATNRPRSLLILTHRSEERKSSQCLQELLDGEHALAREIVTLHVKLLPLADREARELVRQAAGTRPEPGSNQKLDDAWVERIVSEAGGSPLLLTEIASDVGQRFERQEDGPSVLELEARSGRGLEEIVSERVARLSAGARDAFELMCCAGRSVETRLLARLVGEEPDETIRQLDAGRLARARVGGQRLEILHNAMREVTLRRLDQKRAGLHARLAVALESDGGDPAEIARHYEASGQVARASRFAELAGDAASQSFALEHAARMYRLALASTQDDPPRREALRYKLANALADAGLGAEAAPMYAELADHANVAEAIELRRRAAEQWLITGGAAQGMAALEKVQREVGFSWPQEPKDALVTLLLERARIRLSPWGTPKAKQNVTERTRRELDACRAAWPVSLISTIHGAANSSRYLRIALARGDREHIAIGHGMEAMYLASAGARARKGASRSLSLCKKHMGAVPDAGYPRAFLSYAEGQCHYLLGDNREAIGPYEEAESELLASCRNVAWELNSARIFHANALFYLGHHKKLDRCYRTWFADGQQRGDTYITAALAMVRSRRSILKNADHRESNAEIDEGVAMWSSPYWGYHYFAERVCRANVALIVQRPEEAFDILQAAVKDLRSSLMGRVQVARMHVVTHLAYAAIELAADARSATERRKYLHIARSEATEMKRERAPFAIARALLTEGAAELVERPSETAVSRLRQAADIFRSIGHRPECAATEARIAEVVGGDEARELRQSAHAVFAEIEACDWVSALSAFAPRFLPR